MHVPPNAITPGTGVRRQALPVAGGCGRSGVPTFGVMMPHGCSTPDDPFAWLARAACADVPVPEGHNPLDAYFVAPGRALSPGYRALSRACPARRDAVLWAYQQDIAFGYFGGLSAQQRRLMSLEQALAHVEADRPTLTLEQACDLIAREYATGVHDR